MSVRKKEGALTAEEKRVVKALILRGWRHQDIQALVNIGRVATINSGRISEMKQDKHVTPAADDQVAFYQLRKNSYDPSTKLNLFDDERLIRAREAMCLAVQLFNSPAYRFKTEVFAVLANIAWTYLLHEHYVRKKVKIVNDDGNSLALSQMLKRQDCPLSKGIKNNLESLKKIRDAVEHQLLARADARWLPLFQACCLNFDKSLCELFGSELSLQNELGLSLQFAKLDFDQVVTLQKYEIPARVEALDAQMNNALSDEERADLEYQFRVIYTFDSASKSRAHVHFVHPGSEEADQIRNVLVKHKLADEVYPYKPNVVAKSVAEKTGVKFTSNDHVRAWKLFKARPSLNAKQPGNTNQEYCVYHAAHKDYTYSQAWVEFLVEQVKADGGLAKIRAIKL
jgi:hypothetical protein